MSRAWQLEWLLEQTVGLLSVFSPSSVLSFLPSFLFPSLLLPLPHSLLCFQGFLLCHSFLHLGPHRTSSSCTLLYTEAPARIHHEPTSGWVCGTPIPPKGLEPPKGTCHSTAQDLGGTRPRTAVLSSLWGLSTASMRRRGYF